MRVSQYLVDMLNFATPFAPERLANSRRLVRSRVDFLRDLGAWCREKIDQMHSMVPHKPEAVDEFLTLMSRRMFGDSPQLGSTYDEMIEALTEVANTQTGGWFEMDLIGNTMFARREPEVLLLCILKRDILNACCNSNAPGADLTDMFCGLIVFPEGPRPALKMFGVLFEDFTRETGRRRYVPLWAQTEPIQVIENSLTIAFRRGFHGLGEDDPIYTASVDYECFPLATRTQKDEAGTCSTHPRSILFTYDPFRDFTLPRNFRTFDNFAPTEEYGENFELYGGENLVCIKGGDVDIQNLSLICTTRRIAEYKAHVDSDRKVVQIHYGADVLDYPYEGIPEEAYYDFLVDKYRIE